MRCRWLLASIAVVAGCAADARPEPTEPTTEPELPRAPWYDPQPEPPPPARFFDPVAARYHMRMHFNDLRMIEQLLVAGKLDEGVTLSYLLVRQTDDSGIAAWANHSKRVADAATELTKARGLDDAIRLEARVATECASCHVATQSLPAFAPVPALPPDRGTRQTRMARHVWAVDRLWEGLVGADDTRWSRGLAVLAETPLPFTPLTDAPQLAKDLQARARAQLDTRATTLLDDRGTAYGEMLVTCAACHASLHAGSYSEGAPRR